MAFPSARSSSSPRDGQSLPSDAGALRRILAVLSASFRSVLRLLVRIPVVAGRLGVVLGRLTAGLSSTVDRSSTRAMELLDEVKEKAAEVQVEVPKLSTPATRRRERRRRVRRTALWSGLGLGAGAAGVWAWKRKQAADAALEDDLFVTQVEGEPVIDVAAAER